LPRFNDIGRLDTGDVIWETLRLYPAVGAVSSGRIVSVEGTVNWELWRVYSDAIALGVAVGKQADLEDFGCARMVSKAWHGKNSGYVLGSADTSHPGTRFATWNVDCSTSAK
jgi:hypothetical protein